MIHTDPFMDTPSDVNKKVNHCSDDAQLEVKLDSWLTERKVSYKCQWYKDNTECKRKSEHYHGVDTPKLTIKDLKQEHEGKYYCEITVGGSSPICSEKAKLTVKEIHGKSAFFI